MITGVKPFALCVLTLVALSFILVVLSCQTKSAERKAAASEFSQKSAERRAPTPEDRPPLKLPLRDPRIVVRKERRQLLLFSAGSVVRTYHIGLGLRRRHLHSRQWRAERLDMGMCGVGE